MFFLLGFYIKSKAKNLLVMTITCFYFFNIAAELTQSTYLPTYGVFGIWHLTRKEAGILCSLYAAGSLTSRTICIFLSTKVKQINILTTCFIGLALVNLCLCIFTESHLYVLYFLVVMSGFFIGPIFAGIFIWLEQALKNHGGVTMLINACIMTVVAVAIGIVPSVIGQFVESQPIIIFYCVAAFTTASILNFVLALWIANLMEK